MRILALETHPTSSLGGQEHSLLDVCRGLASRGHSVSLGFSRDGDLLPLYEAAGVKPVRVTPFTLDRARAGRSAAGFVSGVARGLGVPFDVLYVNQYHDTMYGSILARLKRVPLVCHLRLMPPGMFCGQWRLGLPGVTRFIAVTKAARDAWLACGLDPLTLDVVYNGIDMHRFVPDSRTAATRRALGIPADAFVVIFAGRLDRMKGLEQLIRAVAAVPRTSADKRLLIVGTPVNHPSPAEADAFLRELRDLAASKGIGESVLWLGRRNDLPALYSASDVCALFSTQPETFGRTLVEAMACGIPSIARELGGVGEVLDGEFSRFLFRGLDDEEPTRALSSLVDWRRHDSMLGVRARAHVEQRFAAERMVAGVENALAAAISRGPARLGPSYSRLKRVGRTV